MVFSSGRWAPVLLLVACGEVLPKDVDGPPANPEGPPIDGSPAGATLYWAELDQTCGQSKLRRLPPSGIPEDVIAVNGPDSIADLALEGGPTPRLYYTFGQSSANGMETVERINLDGSGRQILKSYANRPTPLGIAVDGTNDAVYWLTNQGCSPCPACGACPTIEQSRRDGSANTTVHTITGDVNPRMLALDSQDRKLYFCDLQFQPQIQRVGTDGSAPQVLLTLPSQEGVDDLEIDAAGGKLYWLESTTTIGPAKSIHRMNLDGSGDTRLLSAGGTQDTTPRGLAVDVEGGKLYWTESGFCGGSMPGRIRRANLDGTNIETVLDNLGVLIAIEVTR